MLNTKPVRPKGHRRLVAVCTAGILSLGAFALGTSAQAAEPGSHPSVKRSTVTASHAPHISVPKTGKSRKSPLAAAAAQTPAPLRYDADSDGVGDQLYRGLDDDWYNALASTYEELGASDVEFKDVLTPGNIDGSTGGDVLALTSDGVLQLFGSGYFPYYTSWSGHGWNIYNKVVAVDDLNSDGRADLIARTYDGHLYLYPGTGNAGSPFGARVLIGGGWGAYDQLVSPGDVTGDGISDLVARNTAGNLYVYRGTGSSSAPFAGAVKVGYGYNVYNQLMGFGNSSSGVGGLFARAVNGDLYYYPANGSGGFNSRVRLDGGYDVVDVMAGMGSNTFWGKKALLAVTSNGTLYGYTTDNTGKFYPRYAASDNAAFSGTSLLTYTNALTSNGLPELLYRYGGTLYNADHQVAVGNGWTNYTALLGPGDLNGDGKGDLVGRDSSGKLYLYRGYGNGTSFAARQTIGWGWNTYNQIIGGGDVSGDGRADIIARDTSGGLWLYKGTGVASKPFSGRVKIGQGYQAYNKLASPGDMDGDGRADLIGVDSKTGTLYMYSAKGTGQLKARVAEGKGWNAYNRII